VDEPTKGYSVENRVGFIVRRKCKRKETGKKNSQK